MTNRKIIGSRLSLLLQLSDVHCDPDPTFWIRTPRGSSEFVQIEDFDLLSVIVMQIAPMTSGVIDCKVEIERLELKSEDRNWGAERVIVVAQISETGKIRVLYRQGFDSPEDLIEDLDDPKTYQEVLDIITEKIVEALEALIRLMRTE